MGLDKAIDAAASGLTAQRVRLEIASSNLANARTTRTATGGPYRRQVAIFRAEPDVPSAFDIRRGNAGGGVLVDRVTADGRDPVLRLEPGHPDANAEGYVAYPNVNPTEEMTDLLSAARSYEAGLAVIRTARQLLQNTLNLLR